MVDWDRENEVRTIAGAMIDYDWRILDIASNFMMSPTRVYKSLTKDLRHVDDDMFIQCRNIMQRHKHDKIPRGDRY